MLIENYTDPDLGSSRSKYSVKILPSQSPKSTILTVI